MSFLKAGLVQNRHFWALVRVRALGRSQTVHFLKAGLVQNRHFTDLQAQPQPKFPQQARAVHITVKDFRRLVLLEPRAPRQYRAWTLNSLDTSDGLHAPASGSVCTTAGAQHIKPHTASDLTGCDAGPCPRGDDAVQ